MEVGVNDTDVEEAAGNVPSFELVSTLVDMDPPLLLPLPPGVGVGPLDEPRLDVGVGVVVRSLGEIDFLSPPSASSPSPSSPRK